MYLCAWELACDQLIDLCRDDEVIVAQSADRMGCQFDTQNPIAGDVEIGVMSFGFSQVSDSIHALNGFDEILKANLSSDPAPVVAQ
jgi:hypothetical protein